MCVCVCVCVCPLNKISELVAKCQKEGKCLLCNLAPD